MKLFPRYFQPWAERVLEAVIVFVVSMLAISAWEHQHHYIQALSDRCGKGQIVGRYQ